MTVSLVGGANLQRILILLAAAGAEARAAVMRVGRIPSVYDIGMRYRDIRPLLLHAAIQHGVLIDWVRNLFSPVAQRGRDPSGHARRATIACTQGVTACSKSTRASSTFAAIFTLLCDPVTRSETAAVEADACHCSVSHTWQGSELRA